MTGTADILLRKARFRAGRLEEAEGSIAAGPGAVSQSLIDAATAFLHFVPSPAIQHDANMLRPYEQLSLTFLANAAGLTLHGQWPDTGNRCSFR